MVSKSFTGQMELYSKLQSRKKAKIDIIDTNPIKIYYKKAEKYYALNKLHSSIFYFNKILQINPNELNILRKLGIIYNSLLQFEKAELIWKKILDLRKDDEQAWYLLILNLNEQMKLFESEFCLLNFLKKNPNSIWALNFLANNYFKRELFAPAKKYFQLLKKKDPNNYDALFFLGICEYRFNNFEKAKEFLIQAVKKEPDITLNWYYLGIINFEMHFYNKALSCFDYILNFYPNDIETILNQAFSLYYIENFKDAVKSIKKVIKLDRKNAIAWNTLGSLYEHQDKLNEALGCFKIALNLNPDYEIAKYNLDYITRKIDEQTNDLCLEHGCPSPESARSTFNIPNYGHKHQNCMIK